MIREDLLDPKAREVFLAARRCAEETGTRVALVGGAVRDLLLRRPVVDIDLVGEGDLSRFVECLSAALRVGVHHHERFGTYRLLVEGLDPVDVVTARSETYAYPGALPSVAGSTLEEDLRRRDFPVNCMAWDLREGRLIDPLEGRADLEAGVLRVLHDQSFIDDPTRLLRLYRLAARYGFSIENATRALARDAVEAGMLDRVSSERLRRELDLALEEESVGEVFSRFGSGGLLAHLFGPTSLPVGELDRVRDRVRAVHADLRVSLLAALLGESSCMAAERYWGAALARRICLAARDASSILRLARRTGNVCRLLSAVGRTSAEALALADAQGEPRFSRLRADWESARLDGESLSDIDVPGRVRGLALRKGRMAVASGHHPHSEGLRIARTKALKYLEIG